MSTVAHSPQLRDPRVLRHLIERADEGFFVSSADRGVLHCNPALLRILGAASSEEILASDPRALWEDPADREEFLSLLQERGAVISYAARLRRLDGTVVETVLSAYRLPPDESDRHQPEVGDAAERDGNAEGRSGSDEAAFIGIIRDVSAERRTAAALRDKERFLRALTENASHTFTVLDADGRVRFTTPNVETVLGRSPEEHRSGDPFEHVHPEDADRVRDIWNRLVSTPGTSVSVEYRFRTRDESWKYVETIGKNLLDDPVIRGVVVNSRDVTQRRRLEQRLRSARKLEAVGRLATRVADEFNNLLCTILGNLELAEAHTARPHVLAEDLSEIRGAAERGAELVQQLLNFGGKRPLEARRADLNTTLQRVEPLLRELLGEDVDVVVELDPELDAAMLDRTGIEQAVTHLALYARESMPEGGRLCLSTRSVELGRPLRVTAGTLSPGRYAVLSLADSGDRTGRDPLDTLFEPFFAVPETDRGSGLEVSSVYGILEELGGAIRAEARPGRGTVFELYFPMEEDSLARADGGAVEADSSSSQSR